jgi:phytoene dehydrogenase-like protein
VLFPAYPAVKRNLDLDALDLMALPPSAAVRRGGQEDVLGDPRRDPAALPGTLTTDVLRLGDKLRVGRLALELLAPPPHTLLTGPDETTESYLRAQGFSEAALNTFFRPFFGGIFLRRELDTSARLFRYYFRMLIGGGAALPRAGMGAIPQQLAAGLDIQVGVRVTGLRAHGPHVTLQTSNGELDARSVIVATDPDTAAALLGQNVSRGSLGSTYLYYASERQIDDQPRLLLNAGTGQINTARINNAHWLSNVLPERVPPGQHLLVVTVLGPPTADDAGLDASVRGELAAWYGDSAVVGLRTLGVERIPHAQYPQPPGYAATLPGHATNLSGVLLASEVTSMSGIQGAMESGEKAAAILLDDLAALSRPRGA